MPMRLTDSAIQKAAREVVDTGRRDLADAALPGLRLRLTPTGAKTWVLACRDRHGRMRRFRLGSYPAVGISEARDAARAMHAEVEKGADPIADRKRDRAMGQAAKGGVGTLGALLDSYGDKPGKELKSWADSRKRIDVVFKPLLQRPATALTATDLQMQADAYPSGQSAAFAVRSVRPVLKWAAQRGYVSPDLARLYSPAPVKRRKRVLGGAELAAILPALRASTRPYARALHLMLLTLTRRQEAASARWGDIDLKGGIWTIPETKNGEPHTVPLARQTAALLLSVRPEKPKADAFVFSTSTGAALLNWDRETKAIMEASGTEGWTRHDLRRTGATLLGEMGELPDIIEAALNHVAIRSPLAATYNRSRYRPQVAAALQRLADALDDIEAGNADMTPPRRA